MTARRKRNKNHQKRFLLILAIVAIAFAADHFYRQSQSKHSEGCRFGIELAIPQFTVPAESQIIEHTGYTVSYNQARRNPNWVAYELTSAEVCGEEPRSNDFIPDPQVKGKQATDNDYRKSGWDRGHLAPAADMKWSGQAMKESFYLSNISPQNKNLNRGVWKSIEELARENASRHGKVLVVTGPLFKTEKGKGSIGSNRVTVPDAFYKVLLIESNGFSGIGFYCENVAGKQELYTYARSIDEIEELTGIDFFHLLPDDVEDRIEQKFDWRIWN